MSNVVQILWGFCHTLRHDGVDYGDHIEQLTYLLFLNMADERAAKVPKDCDWESLKAKSGTQLTDHYLHGVEPHIYLGDAIYCLFEGKAGEVFELLMQDCALHTVLRLPRGTFTPYSQGVEK